MDNSYLFMMLVDSLSIIKANELFIIKSLSLVPKKIELTYLMQLMENSILLLKLLYYGDISMDGHR